MPPKPPWPNHWQTPNGNVRCLVFGCEFITWVASDFDMAKELQEHCHDQLGGDHEVLAHMFRQTRCAHDGCKFNDFHPLSSIRCLFQHERSAHDGATSMVHIESFVTLVRQGRVTMPNLDSVKKSIFDRMVDKLYFTGNTMILIYRMGGYFDPVDQRLENLREILSPRALQPDWAPYWQPLPLHLFLMNIAPRADAPADDLWRVLWTRLRLMYAGGRI